MLSHFLDLNRESYDAHHAVNPIKQWLVYLRSHYVQAALLFEKIKRLRDPEDMRSALLREQEQARQKAA